MPPNSSITEQLELFFQPLRQWQKRKNFINRLFSKINLKMTVFSTASCTSKAVSPPFTCGTWTAASPESSSSRRPETDPRWSKGVGTQSMWSRFRLDFLHFRPLSDVIRLGLSYSLWRPYHQAAPYLENGKGWLLDNPKLTGRNLVRVYNFRCGCAIVRHG